MPAVNLPVNIGFAAKPQVAGQGASANGADGGPTGLDDIFAAADAVNPFAQALASVMAVQQAIASVQTTSATPETSGDATSGQSAAATSAAASAFKLAGGVAQQALAANVAVTEPQAGSVVIEPIAKPVETVIPPIVESGLPEAPQAAPATPTAANAAASVPASVENALAAAAAPQAKAAKTPPPADQPTPHTVPAAPVTRLAADLAAAPAPIGDPAPTRETPLPAAPPAATDTAGTAASAPVVAQVAAQAPARPVAPQARDGVKAVDGKPAPKSAAKADIETASAETSAPTGVSARVRTSSVKDDGEAFTLAPAHRGPADQDAPVLADQKPADMPITLAGSEVRAANTSAPVDAGRLAAHTVAHLAAQIIDKVGAKTTRFDVQLDPAGLGKVDVKIEIGAGGQMTAAMSFDNPQAAAEMRGRAGELQSALERAGFDLSKGGLSFDMSGQNNGQGLFEQQADQQRRPTWRGHAFTDLASVADMPPPILRASASGGVDVTI
ncbi:hypothetical protein BH11PSE2_BH11PSE2_18480 [soil metagenome]